MEIDFDLAKVYGVPAIEVSFITVINFIQIFFRTLFSHTLTSISAEKKSSSTRIKETQIKWPPSTLKNLRKKP